MQDKCIFKGFHEVYFDRLSFGIRVSKGDESEKMSRDSQMYPLSFRTSHPSVIILASFLQLVSVVVDGWRQCPGNSCLSFHSIAVAVNGTVGSHFHSSSTGFPQCMLYLSSTVYSCVKMFRNEEKPHHKIRIEDPVISLVNLGDPGQPECCFLQVSPCGSVGLPVSYMWICLAFPLICLLCLFCRT